MKMDGPFSVGEISENGWLGFPLAARGVETRGIGEVALRMSE